MSFATDPVNGDLWFVSIWTGEVHRIRWTGTTAVEPQPGGPLALSAALPNPTRSGITMALDLPRTTFIELRVYDASGRRVWRDLSHEAPAGRHVLSCSGRAENGTPVPPELYLLSVQAGRALLTRRVAVLR